MDMQGEKRVGRLREAVAVVVAAGGEALLEASLAVVIGTQMAVTLPLQRQQLKWESRPPLPQLHGLRTQLLPLPHTRRLLTP